MGLIDRLIARAKRTPFHHLPGYMNRYWLVPWREVVKRQTHDLEEATDGTGPVPFRTRPLAWLIQRCGLAVRLHEILRSDLDHDPHDHPWSFVTVILRGGYMEARYDTERHCIAYQWHGPGSILHRRATDLHKLTLAPDEPCWTLFITGPWRQHWGFQTAEGKVRARDYTSKNSVGE